MQYIEKLFNLLFKNEKWIVFFFIPILSFAMHYQIFSKDLIGIHVWRQTQTQSNINNFVEHDFNILNPTINDTKGGNGILRMEFPIMQWIFALFYKAFGSHLIISRILSFIIGLFSTFGFYFLVKELFNEKKFAFLGAWLFTFSPLLYYYTLNPLPDNFALCFCIWSLYLFIAFIKKGKSVYLFASAFCLGISVLAKLPFIVYLAGYGGYCLYLFYKTRFLYFKKISKIIFAYSLFLLPALVWYIKVIPHWNGNGIVSGVLKNPTDVATTFDILWGHFISTLPELILNYGSVLFFLAGFYFAFKNRTYTSPLFFIFLFISIGVSAYFFFEINMIGKAHDYYLFPFVPLIFIIAFLGLNNIIISHTQLVKGVAILCLLILPFTAFLRTQSRWSDESIGFNADLKTYKTILRNAVPDTALCVVGNDISHHIYFYYIHKKGWAFNDNQLTASELDEMITKGAKYLYSDSRYIDENPEIKKRLSKELLEKGSFKVFELIQGSKD